MTATLTDSIPAHDYHAEKDDGPPRLSSSIAKTLIHKSAAHAFEQHPKLGNAPRSSKPQLDNGTIVHAFVLGKGEELIREIICPDTGTVFENYRTRTAQELRDGAIAEGLTPILRREIAPLQQLAEEIKRQIREQGFELDGMSEAVARWDETTPAGLVHCRGMMDHVRIRTNAVQILDLKTTVDAHPKAIQRAVENFGYDIQAAAYTSALAKVHPELAGKVEFIWLFVEEMPFGSTRRAIVQVARPSGAMRQRGLEKWERACETWAVCLKNRNWPAYANAGIWVEPPAWAMAEEAA